MEKQQYFKIRNLAWEILVKQKVDTLPINIIQICNDMKISVIKANINLDGYSTVRNDENIIYYKQINNIGRIRFTIAHELGHILLNNYNLTLREREKEANMFAARLLTPLGVLQELNVKSAEEISRVCNVSLSMAKIRYARLEMLRQRNKFQTSKLEQSVVHNFQNYITNYNKEHN